MPIAFARLEFVKRSSGKNACGKAAYNSRSRIHSEGSEWQKPYTYNWSYKAPPAYHEILLPKGADSKFQSPEVLWNAAEQKEVRRNSQTAIEMVIALPDDKAISLEDKKYLAKTFVEEHFVKKGLAVQIDIHAPNAKQTVLTKNEEEHPDHNWHAHALITARKFKKNGLEFEDHKARDLMPVIRGGKVVSGAHWGKLWAQHQNIFFEQKGLALRVDTEGVIPQKHLGPVRMRGRAFSLLEEQDARVSLNTLESEDPEKVLHKITQTKNIFSSEDVDRFLHKHTEPEKVFQIKDSFWNQSEIVQLIDPKTNQHLNKFTTKAIIEEEKQVFRLADRLFRQDAHKINLKNAEKFGIHLTQEQKQAFNNILTGKQLACIEGYAGTGKSHLLAALKNTYESKGFVVRGFGPDSATAEVLKDKGFNTAENIYRFLFALENGKRDISKNEVWILDEVGKLGTIPLLELLKCASRHGAQLILSGDSAQLPSIERGMGFKMISDRYKAERLEDIQRQKNIEQRDIAKKLAKGEIGAAFDAIDRRGQFKWTITKKNALEALIKSWSEDQARDPAASKLIIAYSNREIKALNELVRLYRKEAGELEEKEFQCTTAYGKVFASVGDRIEFRRNDKELKVSNGLAGILVKASTTSFTVQVKEDDKTRKVTFDPCTYHHYQLGYAATCNRSQGRTIDKAYVLHSPRMNREMFYVEMTRHVDNVYYYISQEDAKNLSDVKRQAFRTIPKESTLSYLNPHDLEKQQAKFEKDKHIDELKSSGSLLSKAKGIGMSTWDNLRTKTSKIVEQYRDKQADKAFFNSKFDKPDQSGKVQEVIFEKDVELDKQKIRNDFQNLSKVSQDRLESNKTVKFKTQNLWKKLPENKRQLLKEYYKSTDKASSLYTITKSEEETHGGRSPHFEAWQKACGERNERAHELMRCLTEKEKRSVFEAKNLAILQERAAKHEVHFQRQTNPIADLDTKLKDNLEALLHRLFPESPTRKDSKGLRFGSKSSLAVTFTGEKAGSFYDFERGEGGGPIKLIQHCLACSSKEAFQWANDFLGQSSHLKAPSQFTFRKSEKEPDWVSIQPNTKTAPSLEKLSKNLTYTYQETARYAYRDFDGNLLFYTLRLEDHAGKKIVLPLSYGYYKGSDSEPSWSLKGYQADKKPLYNQHLLKEFPKAKVLLVEGEKTADTASKIFPKEKIICLTWSGGSGAVNRSEWQPLFMRDIIVWPDNDKAGFEASESICNELKKIGIKSLKEVDKASLATDLPPKWDLADSLPQGKPPSYIKDMILRAPEKTVGLDALASQLKAQSLPVDIRLANEIMSAIEEKQRVILKNGQELKPYEVRSEILRQTIEVLKDPSRIKDMLETPISLNKEHKRSEEEYLLEDKQKNTVAHKLKGQELEF